MKNKSYFLLLMYDALCAGEGLRISDCCGNYEISVATFLLYIAFLRGYFSEQGKEIVYDTESSEYRLK